jgi:hypothetical protein
MNDKFLFVGIFSTHNIQLNTLLFQMLPKTIKQWPPKLIIQIKNSIYNTFIMGFVITLHIVQNMPFSNTNNIQLQNKWIKKLVYILQIYIFKSCTTV